MVTPNELEHVVRYTGLAISIVGALVVSPAGTHRLVTSTAATARRLARKTSIWFGFVRPGVHHARAVGDTLSTGSAVAHLIAHGSLTVLTLEQQIAQLRDQIASLEELLDRTRRG